MRRTSRDGRDTFLETRIYAADVVEVYRLAYDEAIRQGWELRARDRHWGREFLAVAPGLGPAFQAEVSVSVATLDDGSRLLGRTRTDAPPAVGEVTRYLTALGARLGPSLIG